MKLSRSRSANRLSFATSSLETPSTRTPAPANELRLSRKSHASVVQPGRHGLGVEVEHDRWAAKRRERDGGAVLVVEREVGSEVAGGETCVGHAIHRRHAVWADRTAAAVDASARRWSSSRCSESRRARPVSPSSPAATASMMAQSGASGRWVQPRGQSSAMRGEVGERAEDVGGVRRGRGRTSARRGCRSIQPAPASRLDAQRHRRRRGVPAAPGDGVDAPDGAVGARARARSRASTCRRPEWPTKTVPWPTSAARDLVERHLRRCRLGRPGGRARRSSRGTRPGRRGRSW